jgi:Flp pilus assembly protein TadG
VPCESLHYRPQRGAAFVELSIILPFFVLLVIGTVEIGTAFFNYNTLTKLTFNAARYLSDNATLGSTGVLVLSSTVKAEAENLIVYGKTTAGSTSILRSLSTNDVTIDSPAGLGDHIRVRVDYDYPLMLGQLLSNLMSASGGSFPASLPLSASVVLRIP